VDGEEYGDFGNEKGDGASEVRYELLIVDFPVCTVNGVDGEAREELRDPCSDACLGDFALGG